LFKQKKKLRQKKVVHNGGIKNTQIPDI